MFFIYVFFLTVYLMNIVLKKIEHVVPDVVIFSDVWLEVSLNAGFCQNLNSHQLGILIKEFG